MKKRRARNRKEERSSAQRGVGPQKTAAYGETAVSIVYEDDQILVVDKPAGLTTMRHGYEVAEFGPRGRKFLPRTLEDYLRADLARRGRGSRLYAVHRIDKETSGLVVFARTPQAKQHLMQQFRLHRTERKYLALVRGTARTTRIESRLVRDRGDGRRGSAPDDSSGQRAITYVLVLERFDNYALVQCRLETGRTHQVRIHLGESGTPLCGERVYDRPLHGKPIGPDESGMTRPALHAASLQLVHPRTGNVMSWQCTMANDMVTALKRLRNRNNGSAPR